MDNSVPLMRGISTRELEEFFSGPDALAAGDAAPSPETESVSAAARGTAPIAGQEGGGGGLRPLPAPAPDVLVREFSRDELAQLVADDLAGRTSENEQFPLHGSWVTGPPLRIREAFDTGVGGDRTQHKVLPPGVRLEYDGCLVKLTPADVLALRREQDVVERRNELLIELVFAARQLATESLVRIADAGVTICNSCGRENRHADGCKAHRVLRVLAALEETAGQQAGTAVDQADGAGAEHSKSGDFGEPWRADSGTGIVVNASGFQVYDCDSATELMEDDLERYARRVAACVNFCAGVGTDYLEERSERGLPLAGFIAKGGAR